MPIYESNGKRYNIPDDRVNDFIKSRSDAKLEDDTLYNLSRATSTPQQSNIQKQTDTQVEEATVRQPNNGMTGGFTTFQDGTSGFIPAMKMPEIKIEQPKLDISSAGTGRDTGLLQPFGKSKPLTESIGDVMESMPIRPEAQFDMDQSTYKQNQDWIKEVQNDLSISPEVKQTLLDDYNKNIRISDNTIEDKDLPLYAKKWLEENKVSVPTTVNIPGSPMFGGGKYVESTKQANTPEQIAFIKDFIANTPQGQDLVNRQKAYVKYLENSISDVETRVPELKRKYWQEQYDLSRSHPYPMGKTKGKAETDAARKDYLEKYGALTKRMSALNLAEKNAEEQKKLLAAVRDGDLNVLSQFGKQIGRDFWEMTGDIGTLGIRPMMQSFYESNDMKGLQKRMKSGEPLSEEDMLAMSALANNQAYQELMGDRRTIAQEVASGITQSAPFMVNFATTGGVGKAVTGGAKELLKQGIKRNAVNALRSGVNANTVKIGSRLAGFGLNVADATGRASVMAVISPHTYRDMFDNMTGQVTYGYDEDGKPYYLGNVEQMDVANALFNAWRSNTIENVSEFSGFGMEKGQAALSRLLKQRVPEVAKALSFGSTRNQFFQGVNKAMQTAGFNGTVNEFLEEQVATVLHSFFEDGQAQWSDLVDPRQQFITYLTVAAIGSGSAIMNTGGNQLMKHGAKKAYNNAFQDFGTEFYNSQNNDVTGQFADAIRNGTIDEKQSALADIVNSDLFNDKQKLAALNLYRAGLTYESYEGAKEAQVEEATQEIPAMIEENANPEMGAVVSATIAGQESPVQIRGGNIVPNEDGTINREQSDKEIYYTDAEGKRQVTSINYVENITENIPTQDAIAQVTEQVATPIIAQQQNEEVRPYQIGETIRFSPNGNTSLIGQIEGQDQATGNYLLSVETPNGIQQMQVQPRQIINEDNLEGVENGSPVIYTNQNGEQVQDIVATTPDLYVQGLIGFENGDVVKIENVIGLAGNNEQISQSENVPMPDNMQATTQQNEGRASAEQSNVQSNEPRVFEIEEGLSAVENAAGTYALDKHFTKSELKKADSLVKRLNEDYSDNGLVFETVQLPRKEASNPFEKPLWGVVARMQPETVSNPQPTVANNAPIQPLERKQDKSVKKNTRPKKPIPFQRRLQAVEPNISTVRDRILYGIASGSYKFRWRDNGVSMGLAREMGLSRSETERKSRIGILRNDGYTPSTLAHHIWEKTGGELNDNDIRSEVIDVLSSISSRAQALKALESSLSINEDAYYQEQQDAAEFEQEQIRQAQIYQEEISDQLAAEDIEKLLNLADELGLPLEELGNTYTTFDLVTQLEQLEEIQNEQETDIHTRTEGTSEETNSVASRSESSSETTERTDAGGNQPDEAGSISRQISERRDRSGRISEIRERAKAENTRDTTSDRDSQNDYSNLDDNENTKTSAVRKSEKVSGILESENTESSSLQKQEISNLFSREEQRIVDETSALIDAEIAEIEASIRAKQTELQNKRKELDKEYAKENQTNLFPTEKTSDNLFDVDADFSKQNIESIIKPIENELSSLVNKGRDLMNSKDKRISDALRNFRSQGTIFDAIARAEAETDTNPTDAQKEAGNYKKGKVTIQGFNISIEQPQGSVRNGVDASGKEWSITMNNTYGYIRGTEGKDGDHIDIFLGNNPDSQVVYVVDQVNDKGEFDEHKVMFGFNSIIEARDAYSSNYSRGWQGMGEITGVDIESFRKWTESDSRKIKPFAEYADIKKQSSITRFAPIKENKFNDLVDRLKQTGLAKDVITDKEAFDKKLNEVIDNDAVAKQMLSEMESIKQESIANNTFMLAPNGEKTNLSESQWLQVRTTNFKNWFGDWVNDPANASKVVDENGEPMVVYHGTSADFDVFDKGTLGKNFEQSTLGFYFTNHPMADYSKGWYYGTNASEYAKNAGENPSVMPVFLSIKTPIDIDSDGWYSAIASVDTQRNDIQRWIEKGYEGGDGIIAQDSSLENTDKLYVAFEPTQIKSSLSNNGEFSVDNADIRMQVINTNFADKMDEVLGIEDIEKLGFGELFYTSKPDAKLLKEFNTWLKDNPNAVLRLYHGTSNSLPIQDEGLKKTTNKRRRSYQSTNGYVYLSPFKETAQTFGEIGNPHGSKVYEVIIPIRFLQADRDQLNNQRSAGNNIKNTLAESIVYGRSVRVKGDIPPYLISEINIETHEDNSLQDFRDAHTAPSMDYDTLLEANEEGGDVSLSEIITGKQGLVPDDFFDTRIGSFNSGRKGFVGAIRYGYDTKAGNESINAIKALKDKLSKGEDVQKITARVYRAVPNSISEDTLVNRDWITLSKEYANDHGLSRFGEGEYKIIEQNVPLNKIWWDANSINEFGYDTTENTRFMRTNMGDVYGFVTPDGTVYLDNTRMNANTPIHEFGHLWNSFTKENNAELYNRGAELVKESEYWQRVNDNPSYRDLSDEAKVDEALAMAIGDKGEAIVNRNLKQRFVDWVKDVWNSIREAFGFKTDIAIEDMTLSDFTRKAVRNLLEGKRLTDVMQPTVFSAQDISEMEQIKQSSIDDGSFMKAPNGEPTNLTERQWLQVRTSNFKNWFGDWQNDAENSSKIVDENGEPKVVFHGTTHQFYEFSRDRGNVENHFGIGYYFSDSLTDIENNYLATGADLTNRIDRLAEQLEDNEDLSPEEARERAEEELKGSEEIVLDVYLNMRYPMDVRPDAMYYDALEVYDEENDEYTENEDSMPMELYNALNNIQYNFSETDAQSIWNDVSDAIGGSWDGVSAYDVDKALRSSESLMYITDDEGNLANHEFIRSLYEEMGYDGIIMDADLEFGNRRESGKSMDIDSDTSHYIMFDPSKIKSATENKGDFNNDMNDIRFQSVNDVADATDSTMTEEVKNKLNKELNKTVHKIAEAWFDRWLPVKKLLQTLEKSGLKIEDHNNWYLRADAIASSIQSQYEGIFYNDYMLPLLESISSIESKGYTLRDIENYAMLKGGLERNDLKRTEEIDKYKAEHPDATKEQIEAFEQQLPSDYAGVTAIEEEVGVPAEKYISDFEQNIGNDIISEFWKKKNAATNYTLKRIYEAGGISKSEYDKLLDVKYYIPLRGHDVKTAEDLYDYAPNMGVYFSNPMIKANGRRTRAENPFAYIDQMGLSAIKFANWNSLNQSLYRLAAKDKTNTLTRDKAWYVQTGISEDGTLIWESQEPAYSENPEQYRKNQDEFEKRMLNLQKEGLAMQQRGRFDLGGLFIKPTQREQHRVSVWVNGNEHSIYINANPAIARSINTTNLKQRVNDEQYKEGILKAAYLLNEGLGKTQRWMANNITSKSPEFLMRNLMRDVIQSATILPVKEGLKYEKDFLTNLPKSAAALSRYLAGKSNIANPTDAALVNFFLNGGATGYVHFLELQKNQKKINREISDLKKSNFVKTYGFLKYIPDSIEAANKWAENLSRFAVYLTSMQQGRSIARSISDAKEVTVNFNRTGSGKMGNSLLRNNYMFINPALQAMYNMAGVASKNRKKFTALTIAFGSLGFIAPMLSLMIGGDDGWDEYWNLSEWDRQNNFCIYTGNGFVKISLPQEFRIFTRIGDNMLSAILDKKDKTEASVDSVLGFADLSPVNPLGASTDDLKNISEGGLLTKIMPDRYAPFVELAVNKNFANNRIYNQYANKNSPGHKQSLTNKKGDYKSPDWLVDFSKALNDITGGDDVSRGVISLNPDKLNHLLRSYLGGMYTTAAQAADVTNRALDPDKKVEIRNTPLRAVYISSDDIQSRGNPKYFDIQKGIDKKMYEIKGYQKEVGQGKLGIDDFVKKLNSLNHAKILELNKRIKQIKKHESALKELDGQDQKDLEKIISDLKKEVIEINNKLSE